MAELADHDGWELLINLAREMGHGGMADRFQEALKDETIHLAAIRDLLRQSTLADAGK